MGGRAGCLSVRPSVRLSVRLSVCLSVCLTVRANIGHNVECTNILKRYVMGRANATA